MYGIYKKILVVWLLCLPSSYLWADYAVHQGRLGKALYSYALPDNWNGNVVIHCHGYRTEEQPLSATIEFDRQPWATFVNRGWMVAASSYRRNGWIVNDAVEDVLALKTFLEDKVGALEDKLLIGESMGGAITLRLLERGESDYLGAMILGAGLFSEDPAPLQSTPLPSSLSAPVLFMTNNSELADPKNYIDQVEANCLEGPALWVVDRAGHLNFNKQELHECAVALLDWSERGVRPRDRVFTRAGQAEGPLAKFVDGTAAKAKVIAIDPNFGNLTTHFRYADFNKLGIEKGDSFELVYGKSVQRIQYVTTYSDVNRGDWLAFPTGEGNVQIAINYGHAADTLKAGVGSELLIRAL